MSLANYPPDHPGFGRLIKDLCLDMEKIGEVIREGELGTLWKVKFGPKELPIEIGDMHLSQAGIIAKRYEPGMPVRRCETMKEACAFLEGHI